jgi:hypothetical protein
MSYMVEVIVIASWLSLPFSIGAIIYFAFRIADRIQKAKEKHSPTRENLRSPKKSTLR